MGKWGKEVKGKNGELKEVWKGLWEKQKIGGGEWKEWKDGREEKTTKRKIKSNGHKMLYVQN